MMATSEWRGRVLKIDRERERETHKVVDLILNIVRPRRVWTELV